MSGSCVDATICAAVASGGFVRNSVPNDGTNRVSNPDPEIWVVRHPGGFESQSDRGPLHFHMLVLDGVYVENDYGGLRFHRVKAPNVAELKALMHAISHRVARFLEKRGFLERDAENSYLALEQDDDDAMVQLQGHSITYRIAVGPRQGRKVFTLQTLPPDDDSSAGLYPRLHWGGGAVV